MSCLGGNQIYGEMDKQEGPELKRDMQKSGVRLGLAESKAISPGKGGQNMGVGRPEAELSLSQVHVSGTSSLELGCTGSWEDAKGPLALPGLCIRSFTDVLGELDFRLLGGKG